MLAHFAGLTTMAGSLAYAVGPAAGAALFAVSHADSAKGAGATGQKLLGGHLWWILLVVVAIVNVVFSASLSDVGFGGPRKTSLDTIDEDDERTLGGDVDDEIALQALKHERPEEDIQSSSPPGRRW